MKKVALILFICIYSFAIMGFSLKQFYCCGKLKSTTFSLASSEKKECDKGNEKSGCCHNKYQFFKVKDNHITVDEIHIPVKHFADRHIFTPCFEVIALAKKPMAVANASHAPPLHYEVPVYILNCNFLI